MPQFRARAHQRSRARGGMIDRARAIMSAPFPPEYRALGVLLHITSLPSRHGVGDFGPSARAWIDRLADAGQSWRQSLPLGPAGYGNSPYQPLSTFAENELLVSQFAHCRTSPSSASQHTGLRPLVCTRAQIRSGANRQLVSGNEPRYRATRQVRPKRGRAVEAAGA